MILQKAVFGPRVGGNLAAQLPPDVVRQQQVLFGVLDFVPQLCLTSLELRLALVVAVVFPVGHRSQLFVDQTVLLFRRIIFVFVLVFFQLTQLVLVHISGIDFIIIIVSFLILFVIQLLIVQFNILLLHRFTAGG